jgi:hypothetical protein
MWWPTVRAWHASAPANVVAAVWQHQQRSTATAFLTRELPAAMLRLNIGEPLIELGLEEDD